MLKAWAIDYFKQKDVYKKDILKIIEKGNTYVLIKKKTADLHILIYPVIEDMNEIVERLNDINTALIVLNTEDNLKSLIKNWNRLISYEKFSIYFVNPKSQLETKWIVYPYTHEKIIDRSALKKGLYSMFMSVEPYS